LVDNAPLLGKKEFDQMKDGAYIINTARGNVICFDAMLEALDSGKLSGAALDVFPNEPLTDKRIYCHDKISLTPHIGASTIEAQKRIGEEIVKIIQQFFMG
jgi:D-3-phosphoglycerate dehydrogenase